MMENNNIESPGTALVATNNGGESWFPIYRGHVQFSDIWGQDADRLWLVGKGVNNVPNDAVLIMFRPTTKNAGNSEYQR